MYGAPNEDKFYNRNISTSYNLIITNYHVKYRIEELIATVTVLHALSEDITLAPINMVIDKICAIKENS